MKILQIVLSLYEGRVITFINDYISDDQKPSEVKYNINSLDLHQCDPYTIMHPSQTATQKTSLFLNNISYRYKFDNKHCRINKY